jgi:hypothetical protein
MFMNYQVTTFRISVDLELRSATYSQGGKEQPAYNKKEEG